ncbi:MAG TPA: tetratricopeptide repeat protein [Polyangiaceae bacterium]|nr:tetratricopeptide repeat protein [Polyangiaceae bacterium]
MARGRLAWLCACTLGLLGCGTTQSTQRVFDGHLVVGPYVEPEAYAAFAEGTYLEARGEWEAAASAYRRARTRDPDSPSIAARLGAIACRTSLEAGLDELQTSGIARDYAPAWAERARCLLAHHDRPRALEAAQRAVMLDPSNPDANLSIAQIHREQGHPDRARAWLFAWALGDPDAAAYRDAIEEQARLLDDAALAVLVATRGRQHAEEAGSVEDVAPLSPTELAERAIARGEPEAASQHAALALQANPEDADAAIVALFAASLELDEARFLELLRALRTGKEAPGADASAWMAELLRARVGEGAAERWLAAQRRIKPPEP